MLLDVYENVGKAYERLTLIKGRNTITLDQTDRLDLTEIVMAILITWSARRAIICLPSSCSGAISSCHSVSRADGISPQLKRTQLSEEELTWLT